MLGCNSSESTTGKVALSLGRLFNRWMASAHSEFEWNMKPDQANWLVVEIRSGNGEMLAITNPIFLYRSLPAISHRKLCLTR